jgi:hypothetical protein
MEELESDRINSSPVKVGFWRRYVDDVFAIVEKAGVQQLLQHLNSYDDNIQFTVEMEKDGSLPFLDTQLTRRRDGSIALTVYRKPTHTGQHLHWDSNHPFEHKASVVHSLVSRAFTHCSTAGSRKKELNVVRAELQSNAYPDAVVNRMVTKVRRHFTSNVTARGLSTAQEPRGLAVLSYNGQLSQYVKRKLVTHGVRVAFKPTHRMASKLTQVKDPVKMENRANVVYEIPCGSCEVRYIGETGRRLRDRLYEHKTAIRKCDAKASALVEHVVTEDHLPAWDKVRVLRGCSSYFQRKWAEAVEIRTHPTVLNRVDGAKLDGIYTTVLQQQ